MVHGQQLALGRADGIHHFQTAAVAAAHDRNVVIRRAERLAHHALVAREGAGGDDDGLGVDGQLAAVFPGAHSADDRARLIGEQLGGGGVPADIHAVLIQILLEVDERLGVVPAVIDDGLVEVRNLLSGLAQVDVDVVVEQVLNGVLRLAHEGADQRGVAQLVALLHVLVEPVFLVGTEVVAIALLLKRGADGEHALRGVAHAAQSRGGFHADDLRAVLSGGKRGGGAGSAHADDQHVAVGDFVLTLDDFGLLKGQARLRKRGGRGFDDGVGSQGRAGDGIDIRRLIRDDRFAELRHGRAAQRGRLADAGSLSRGDLAVFNGNSDRHVAAKALGGGGVGLGAGHRRAKDHGGSEHGAERSLHVLHEKNTPFSFFATGERRSSLRL